MKSDRFFLKKAIKLAAEGISGGKGPFGALITRDMKIISEAGNMVVSTHDPTAHAEILAIRNASASLGTHDLSDCVIYTSCEPCPMCLGAIYWAGIKRVVYASGRNDAAEAGFNDSFIYDEIALDPEKRKIDFIRMKDTGGEEVFKKWIDFEGKIPY